MAGESAIVDPRQREYLAAFADPEQFAAPVLLEELEPKEASQFLRTMLRIRYCEEAIGELVRSGEARCPCHLGIGQEAIATGVSCALTPNDKVFGAHRSHAHFLALGGDVRALIAEVLGKITGCSRGMGGSMHLFDPSIGFMGSVPIVAATIPIAVGAAIALKFDRGDAVAVSYFGDGSSEEGSFHESLNLAATQQLPVIFVCENNLYSSHLDIKLRQPSDLVSRFAVAHRIESLLVDGNDVAAVSRAARTLLRTAREKRRPVFLEAVTFRWCGHVGPDENVDVGLRRKEEDIAAWKKRDPIARLKEALLTARTMSAKDFLTLEQEEQELVQSAVETARRDPYPPTNQLINTVFLQS